MPTIISENTKNSIIMDKLKDSILRVANSDPNNPLSSSQISFLNQQLQLAFPFLKTTPTHPTYAAMIQNAIKELNEEDGSNQESISVFIKENYEGLPWAHSMYLAHHLSKLCENGEIVWNSISKCYSLSAWAGIEDGHSRKKPRKRRLVRKTKEGGNEDRDGSSCGEKVVEGNGDLNEDIEEVGRNEDEEGRLSGEKAVEGSGNFNGYEEEDTEEIARSRTKPRRRSLLFFEESDEVGRTAVNEGEQILVAERLNNVSQGDGSGDTSDAIKLLLVPNECAEELPVTSVAPSVSVVKDDKDPELTVKESTLKGGDIPVQLEILEGNSKMKLSTRRLGRKRKGVVIEGEEGNSNGEEVLEVSGNLTGFQEKDIEEFERSMAKTKSRRLVCEKNDEVRGTAIDGREQNLVAERQNEVLSRGDGDDDAIDAAKMVLVPAECVEVPPVTLIPPSASNIRGGIDPKLAGKQSGLKESELMIVPYERNTSIASAEINSFSDAKGRMLICALPCTLVQKKLESKKSPKNRLRACKKEKKNLSLELIPSSSASAGIPNVLELGKKSSVHKSLPKKRLRSGQEKLEVSLETTPSSLALTVDRNLRDHNRLKELLSLRGLETKASGMESEVGPAWLVPMLNGQYFFRCPIHVGPARSCCKMFCLDCIGDAFCLQCLPHHKDHRVVQVRMSSNYYFVNVDDMQRWLDISSIQTYTNNNAKILYINHRTHLKPGKGSTRCENCNCGLTDSVRFCSLRCKLCIALCGSTNFLPVDQSQQTSTSSLPEDASIEPSETEKNFGPSSHSRLQDPMSVVEEDLPLKKVLEKCTKRKKQVELKLTADALATEASSLLGSKSQLDQPILENFKPHIEDQERQSQNDVKQVVLNDVEATVEDKLRVDTPLATESPSLLGLKSQVDQPISETKQQVKGKERQSQNDVQLDAVEAPMDTSVERNVLTSYDKCDPEPKLSLVDQPISDNSKQQIEDEDRQRQNDVGLDDVEVPMDTTFKGNVPTVFKKREQEPKQSQVDQPFLEVSEQHVEDNGRQSQNDVEYDDVEAHMDTSVEGNDSSFHKKSEQEPKQSRVDQPVSENSKQVEDEERQSQNNIELDDVEVPMDKSVEKNVPTSFKKCEQEPKQSQVDQPISDKCEQQMEDVERQSQSDVRLDGAEGPMDKSVMGNVPTSYKKCEQEPKHSQVDQLISGNSKQQMEDEESESHNDVGLDDFEAPRGTSVERNMPTDKKYEQETKQSEATKDSVNLQCEKLKKVVEEKLEKIVDVTKDVATQKPNNDGRGRLRKQECLSDPETNQDSQQQIKPEKKKGRGRPPKHLKTAKNEAAVSSNLQLQQQAESEELIKRLEKERRGRPRNKQEANKEDSTVQLELAQKLEEKEHRADLENSQSDEGEQARPPSDDNINETMKNQNLDGTDQSDQKQNEQECHEHGKLASKGYVRPPKVKSGKSTSIQVPLSSKDHLRSRIKHQSQNST